jgi:hypothetical protein
MTQPHSDRAHATLAPSAAHRWLACPGSVRMSEGIQEAPSVFAAEGTAAHELAEYCLTKGLDVAQFRGWIVAKGGLHHPDEGGPPDQKTCFRVDAEMVDGVQLYLDVARDVKAQSDEFETEIRMDMSALVPGVFGTGDVIAYREKPTRRVTICDFKYGKGVSVEVEDNAQLLTYAMGVVQRYHNRGVDEVELIVVQPRAPHRDGPVRRAVIDVIELYEHVMALQDAAKLASDPNAPFVPGRKQCNFCKGAARCRALKKRVEEIVAVDPIHAPYKPWAQEQDEIELVKLWARRREEHAHAEALRDPAFAASIGAKLVGKRPMRKWKDENAAVETLQLLGVPDDDIWETSMRSPAQIEKALPKKDRKILETLAIKSSSGTVLAPMDDPRPAVDPNDAAGFDDHSGAE